MPKFSAKPPKYRVPKFSLPAKYKKQIPDVSHFEEDVQALGEEIAKEFLELLLDNIEKNKFGFKLNPATVKRKGSDLPWVDTGELLKSFKQDGTVVTLEEGMHSSGLSYKHLASILEYGVKDRGIPGRAVWRKTFEEFEPTVREKIKLFLDGDKNSKNVSES